MFGRMVEQIRYFALRYMVADMPPLSPGERWRSFIGALLGLAVAGLLVIWLPLPGAHRWLIAPVGASAVILFALPHSPLAQPWSVLGGYFAATLAAVVSSYILPTPALASVAAVAGCVWLMTRFRCLHPPGGALAFLIVFEGAHSPDQLLQNFVIVGINALVLLLAALFVNNLILRRRYPHCRAAPPANPHRTLDAPPISRTGLSNQDLRAAVQKVDTFLDIQDNDLLSVYNFAVDHAFERHLGLRCGDVMARDIVTIEFAAELQEAWTLLRAYKVHALPVIDRASRRLLGIVTVADFLRQIDATRMSSLAEKIQGLLRRSPGVTSEKAEVVGQIMTVNPYAVTAETSVVEVVKKLSDAGLHHVPVVDEKQRVIGMLTQSDLIAALYKHVALERSLAGAAQSVASDAFALPVV